MTSDHNTTAENISYSSITEIFKKNRVIKTPFFQRSYVWNKEKNWDRFLDNMEEVSKDSKDFFFGIVILKHINKAGGGNEELYLIDGQQRLTTLIVFLKFLCLKTKNSENEKCFNKLFIRTKHGTAIPALEHNGNDRESFIRILNLEVYKKELNGNSSSDRDLNNQHRIISFYNYLSKKIESDADLEKYNYHNILEHLRFIDYHIEHNQDENKIFDMINSPGVRLTSAELLKNYLFNYENQQESEKLYESYWGDPFEKDDETKKFWRKDVVKSPLRQNIELFLYAYLQIKINDKEIKMDSKTKKAYNKIDNTYEGYKWLVEKGHIKRTDLMKEIKENAYLYRNKLKLPTSNNKIDYNNIYERVSVLIFDVRNTVLIPYVLYILINSSQEEQMKILGYLESYIIRRIICRSETRNYNRIFSNELIASGVKTLGGMDRIDGIIENINNREGTGAAMPSDREIRESIKEESHLSNLQALAVLYFLEAAMTDDNKDTHILTNIRKYTLEHIMPKKWEENWPLSTGAAEDEREIRHQTLRTLGNLAIIPKGLNSKIRNSNWENKRNALKKHAKGLKTLEDFLEENVWDEETIEKRAKWLADRALEFWRSYDK